MRSSSGLIPLSILCAVAGACGGDDNPGSQPSSATFTIGGTLTGLTTDGLVLENNGGDDLAVAANANTFVFATKVKSGAPYDVTVHTQPAGEVCTVTGGSGVASADVLSVSIACTAQQASVAEWTWAGGSDTAPNFGRSGVYGTLGTADAANLPGGRQQSASWRDSAGNLWLFGGYGVDSAGASGQLNDLWKFEPGSGNWTWMSGTNVAPASTTGGAGGSPGVYGTLGTAAATNLLGGREQTCSWVDSSGAVWIFGGEGIDVNGVTGELNDLWKLDAGQWTWMGGSDSVGPAFAFGGPPGTYGTLRSPDPGNVPGGRYGAVCWKDAQGNLWLFGGSGIDSTGFAGSLDYLNDLWKYTPGAGGTMGAWTWMAGPKTVPTGTFNGAAGVYGTRGTPASTNYPGGRDAAMSWYDASGNVWIFGGLAIDAAGTFGFMNDLWKYTPTTGEWTWVSGSSTVDQEGSGPSGVYGTLGTPAADTVPGGRYSASTWIDASGNLWLMGGQGYDSAGTNGALNDLWKFDPTAGQWTWVSGSTTAGASGVYGTLGTAAATSVPGARFGTPTWSDGSKLWLFGGMGNDSTGAQGYLNDLWNYQP